MYELKFRDKVWTFASYTEIMDFLQANKTLIEKGEIIMGLSLTQIELDSIPSVPSYGHIAIEDALACAHYVIYTSRSFSEAVNKRSNERKKLYREDTPRKETVRNNCCRHLKLIANDWNNLKVNPSYRRKIAKAIVKKDIYAKNKVIETFKVQI